MSPELQSKSLGIKFKIEDLPAPLCPTSAVIFPPEIVIFRFFKIKFSDLLYLKLQLLNFISQLFSFKLVLFYLSIISFLVSIIGKILLAADKPWFTDIFNVASDLTG